jgi:lipopolysaccharide export system protein LptA
VAVLENGRAQLRADTAQIRRDGEKKGYIRLIGYDVAFRFAAVRGGNVKRARAEEKRTGGIKVLFGVLL